MRSVLDIIGSFLFLGYRLIMLPILAVLYSFFGLLAAFQYTRAGWHWMRHLKLKPLQPIYQLIRFSLHFGKRLHTWHLHKG